MLKGFLFCWWLSLTGGFSSGGALNDRGTNNKKKQSRKKNSKRKMKSFIMYKTSPEQKTACNSLTLNL